MSTTPGTTVSFQDPDARLSRTLVGTVIRDNGDGTLSVKSGSLVYREILADRVKGA